MHGGQGVCSEQLDYHEEPDEVDSGVDAQLQAHDPPRGFPVFGRLCGRLGRPGGGDSGCVSFGENCGLAVRAAMAVSGRWVSAGARLGVGVV